MAIDLFEFVFGERPGRLAHIAVPPEGVAWRRVRPRADQVVTASLADRSGVLHTRRGPLHYRAGEHYIVDRKTGDRHVVHRNTFDRTYRKRDDGAYEKRTEISYRYFTLPRAVIVETPEGPQRAEAGDWIMEGGEGELWPVAPRKAAQIYEPEAS